MSFYNKDILKASDLKEAKHKAHIDDLMAETDDDYLKKTFEQRKKEVIIEVSKMREEKLKELEDEISMIREKAYLEGKENAEKEAMEKLTSEMAEKLELNYESEMEKVRSKFHEANHYYRKQIEDVKVKKDKWVSENQAQIVDIITNTLEKLLGKSVELETHDMKNVLNESLDEVNDRSKKVFVRVNPQAKQTLDQDDLNWDNVEILSDPNLEKLDVLIETETEWVDSTVKNKLERIKNIIKEWVEKNEPLR